MNDSPRDRGSILPIVLVVTVVLALVVVGIATYASATLRHGQVVEQSADRLATADGAMDNALEALSRNTSLCALSSLSSQPGGYTFQLGDKINGIDPTINCTAVGGSVKAVDAFAVIMTGARGQTGPLLTVTNGGSSAQAQKTFEGPIYLARVPNSSSTSFSANLTIKNGDVWYTGACPDDPALALDSRLSITPAGYGTQCVSQDWETLFASRRPVEFDVDTLTAAPTAPTVDLDECHVWGPGIYADPPALTNQSYNYFKSGNYYFENTGNWTIDNAFVLFGYPGPSGPSIPGYTNSDTFAGNPCNTAWQGDDDTGATLYMGGDSRLTIEQNGALEISGRDQGAYHVAVQALEDDPVRASTLNGEQRVVQTGSGSNKQLSIQGLVWAPYTGLAFDLIANDAVAALTGGAVVSELSAGASAQANNFLITVDTQPSTNSFEFTATAQNSGTTAVRAVVTYRTDGFYELKSRRVLGLTPE
jgi:hypothetical protein